MEIKLYDLVSSFAENKDIAREIRLKKIIPALKKKEEIVLNFQQIDSATQAFIHTLISDLFRRYGSDVLDFLIFKNCSENVQKIITVVTEYMQEI